MMRLGLTGVEGGAVTFSLIDLPGLSVENCSGRGGAFRSLLNTWPD